MTGIRSKDAKRLRQGLADPITFRKLFKCDSLFYFGDEVLELIRARIPEGSTVVELGGGASTLELVKYYNVYVVEDRKEYLNLTPDATYIHAPLVPYYDKGCNRYSVWYDREVLKKSLPSEYDLLIIDGPEVEKDQLGRYGAARYYAELFRTDVPVLIDDLQATIVYLSTVVIAREKDLRSFEINITKGNRVFAWLG